MGDRIAVMNEGVLEQVGTPEELYERPANRFVAGFIGSPAMSFFEASVADGRLRAAEIDLSVNGASLPPSVVVGVRPEHARPWREGLIGPLRGQVAFVEALGRETFIGVDVGRRGWSSSRRAARRATWGRRSSSASSRPGLRYRPRDVHRRRCRFVAAGRLRGGSRDA